MLCFVYAQGLPDELAKLLDYARKLNFEETPDYNFMRQLLGSCFRRHGFINDQKYDWDV